jgi:hypothetical protein
LYFYISMGVAIFAFGIMGLAFVRGGIEDIVRGPKTMEPYAEIEDGSIGVVTTKGREEGDHSWGKIKRLLTNPLILALMMWSFFYVSHACLTEAELTDRPEQNRALADTWYV